MEMGLEHPEVFRAVFHSSTNRALCRLLMKESFRNSAVSVWNGAWWKGVTHGSKRCYGCGLYYKLNFVSERGLSAQYVTGPAKRFDRADYRVRGLPLCILAPVVDSDVQSKRACRNRSSYHHDGAPSAVIGNAKYNDWENRGKSAM